MLNCTFNDKLPPAAIPPCKTSSWYKGPCASLLSATMWMSLSGPASTPAVAQQPPQKPNILFIMGDDIGLYQPSIYHRGLMVGETPNIDRIGNEGAIFTHYYAEQSCTAGRNAFFTGMHPLRTGMIPPQLPGSPSYLRPGTPAIAKFLLDLGYNTGEFGKARDDDLAPVSFAAAQTVKKQCLNTCRARYRDCRRLNRVPSFECQGVYQDCARYACTGLGPG
jgi:arylsulfatase